MKVRQLITKDHKSTQSPEETRALAASLITQLEPGSVVALHGDLGAGKTCFVQGAAKALGIKEDITSPTYTLINEYAATPPLFHIDLYRTDTPQEALNFGIDEYLESDGITLIEWADRAAELLPEHTMHVRIEAGAHENERTILITRIESPE